MNAPRRALSLHARQLIAASLSLIAFLGMIGVALDKAFQNTLINNMEERLDRYANTYFGEIDFDANGKLIKKSLRAPDARLDATPSSLFAQIVGKDVEWKSLSARKFITLPDLQLGKVGDKGLSAQPVILGADGETRIKAYQYTKTIDHELVNSRKKNKSIVLTLRIYESEQEIFTQIGKFRKSLWIYLVVAGFLLVLVQIFILRWSLQPLRTLEYDMQSLQIGKQPRLNSAYPLELKPITNSINALIDSERSNLEISRNTLADLAHSLKTPLAVLQSQIENESDSISFKSDVSNQVLRMNDIVSYQLSRASRAGHALYSAPIDVLLHAESIVQSLEKIYQAKGIYCEFEIDAKSQFSGELGDLQELLGNFLENAFKWANKRVLLTAKPIYEPAAKRPGLFIMIEDDGVGIANEDITKILQRGVRGDERVQGHGIGMAIVQDIIKSYQGELAVDSSVDLGGARFTIKLPCLT